MDDEKLIKSKERVQQHGEVFTPQWMVKKMLDVEGIKQACENIDATFLEPAAGDGNFLVAILERKLKVVTEQFSEGHWGTKSLFALSSIYGIEFLADNLEIARSRMLIHYLNWYEEIFQEKLHSTTDLYKSAMYIISRNIVRGNTLTKKHPDYDIPIMFNEWKKVKGSSSKVEKIEFTFSSLFENEEVLEKGISEGKLSLFDFEMFDEENKEKKDDSVIIDIKKIYKSGYKNWTTNILYVEEINQKLKSNLTETIEEIQKGLNVMKFDVVIGNPPYQEDSAGTSTRAEPVYQLFMELAYKIADKTVLITPARFLFNAGSTPKSWNEKMLADEHLKVVYFEQDSSKIFPNTDIKGGVVITYRDSKNIFGAINIFTHFNELNTLYEKVKNEESFSKKIYNRGLYRYSDRIYVDHEYEMKTISDRRLGSNAFEKLPKLFYSEKPNDKYNYIQIYGRENGERKYKWFRRDYLNDTENFDGWKVIIPKANGSGALGEVLATPLIGTPLIGHTETFLSIGNFKNELEAESCLKYVKTKFARACLGILKITQDNTADKWKYVPLQDFTANSDIDWKKSISEIDKQLYTKYALSQKEVDFIEGKVKLME